jgi:hypothetical protein
MLDDREKIEFRGACRRGNICKIRKYGSVSQGALMCEQER